ncbi:MAG: S26 family signal peptidase [Planctomycetota bacterium]
MFARTRTVERLIFLCGLLVAFIGFLTGLGCRQPADNPDTMWVAGGSMAPAMLGAHFQKSCDDCGFVIQFDTVPTLQTSADACVCPNCGLEQPFDATKINIGDEVTIEPVAADIQRGQIVAFVAQSEDGPRRTVKRIVGMPGESIKLRDGDVFIDGECHVKSLQELLDQSIVVYDDRFIPAQPAYRRLRPAQRDTNWKSIEGGYHWKGQSNDSDELVYHQSEGLPLPFKRGTSCELRDNYGYNQFRSRQLNTITDWYVTAELEWHGDIQAEMRLAVRGWLGELRLELDANQLKLATPDREITDSYSDQMTSANRLRLLAGFADGRWIVAVNDVPVAEVPATTDDLSKADGKNTYDHRPLRIVASGSGQLNVLHLKIWRDIYYLDPSDNKGPDEVWSCNLGANEFLMLGDNSPISRDGRQGAAYGIIHRNEILGVVEPK